MIENVELPKGWATARLDEVSSLVFGQSPPSSTYNSKGTGLPFFQGKADFGTLHPTASKWCTQPTRIAEAGDVLISVRAPVGPTNVADQRCAIGRGLAAIRTLVSKNYIRYWLLRSRDELASKGTGTTFSAITKDILKSHPIPVAPLNEQQRIVEKIETLFARINKGEEALREVQKLLKRYRQSILKAAVTGELTRDWREANQHKLEPASDLLARILETQRENWEGPGKYKHPASPDTTELPDLPKCWTWATLPMLGELGRGKSKHRPRNDPRLYEDGAYPFLQTGRVRNSSGRISDYDKLYSEFGLSQSRLWPAGTVCITIAANIAESGILDLDACFPDSIVGFIPAENISAEYVEAFIRTAKRDLDRYAPATAQKNINVEILNNLAVPLPPTEEQEQIRTSLDATFATIDSLEETCSVECTRSTALRQSILKSAFTGQLVPQDPNDEPASELLARIRAECEAKPKAIPRRKAGT